MTLKGHYVPCFKTRASFGAHHEYFPFGDDDVAQWLYSDNIRFMRIFAVVPWKGGVIQQWGNRKRFFALRIRHPRKWGQHYYIVLFSPLSPFRWPQNTCNIGNLVQGKHPLKNHFSHMFTITNCHWVIVCYLFAVACLLHVWSSHVTSGEVREAE